MDREQLLVELVDEHGESAGRCSVAAAHAAPGRLHRAFSVLLLDEDGRLLLQRRASSKTRFALRWSNTCCGHPAPGEDVAAAGARRLAEELGVAGVDLAEAGTFRYSALDPVTALVEEEHDHVLVGRVSVAGVQVRPDAAEVAECRWVTPEEAVALLGDPGTCTPWLGDVLAVAGVAARR